MRPRRWEGRRERGSVTSRTEQGCPWQNCNRAWGWGWWKPLGWAGRWVAAGLGGWAPPAAFLVTSKLRRPQGFHNPGNGLSKKSGKWRKGKGWQEPSKAPPPGPVPHMPSPVLGGPAMVSGHGQGPEQGMLPTPAPLQD